MSYKDEDSAAASHGLGFPGREGGATLVTQWALLSYH